MTERAGDDPRPAIGDIVAELIAAGCEWQNGNPAGLRRRLKKATQAITALRVMLDLPCATATKSKP